MNGFKPFGLSDPMAAVTLQREKATTRHNLYQRRPSGLLTYSAYRLQSLARSTETVLLSSLILIEALVLWL